MKPTFHYIDQRTAEWDALRAGKLTASVAKKLVTPTGKASTQYKGEISRIIAERMGLQEPEFIRPTYWMERGVDLEPQAKAWFEVETDLTVTEIGFVSDESGLIGASPDGLIDYDPLNSKKPTVPLELKCPKPSTHIEWLIAGGVPKEHISQVHFQMALCKAPHAYFCSYNPDVAPLIVKVEWCDFTDTMVKSIGRYCDEFSHALKFINGEL